MFFVLKIVRFFFRLLLKLVLLPFKLLKRLMGNEESPEDWSTGDIESGDQADAVTTDATTTDAATTGTRTTAPGELSEAAAQAKKNIRWFRRGLIAVGGIQLLVGLFVVLNLAQSPIGSMRPGMVDAMLLAVVIFSIAPIGIGLGLPRWPKASWYLGMAVCGIQGVLSLFSLPGGLVTIGIYGGLGYLGYTGRPALVTFSDAGDAVADDPPAATEPSDRQSQPPREAADDDAADPSRSDAPADRPDEATASAPTAQTDTAEAAAAESPSEPAGASGTAAAESASELAGTPGADETGDSDPDASRGDEAEADATTTEAAGRSDAAADDADPIAEYRERLRADAPSARKSAVEDLVAATDTESVPGQPAIDALSERLDDDDPAVRAAACRGLGQLGAEQVKPKLKDLRIDTDSDVSRAASEALQNIE